MSDALSSKNQHKNFLYVEGDDDKNVFIHFLNRRGITSPDPKKRNLFISNNESFEIKNVEGIDELLKAIKLVLKGDVTYNRYGIIVDADDDLDVTWQRLRNILVQAGYQNVPGSPDPQGTILQQQELPIVGIWLMPNNKVPGMIEDFISLLIPDDDILWPVATEVVEKVTVTQCKFRPSYKSKACIHTWLAWQEEPGKPLGQAITKGFVNSDAPLGHLLVIWFRRLFELDAAS